MLSRTAVGVLIRRPVARNDEKNTPRKKTLPQHLRRMLCLLPLQEVFVVGTTKPINIEVEREVPQQGPVACGFSFECWPVWRLRRGPSGRRFSSNITGLSRSFGPPLFWVQTTWPGLLQRGLFSLCCTGGRTCKKRR